MKSLEDSALQPASSASQYSFPPDLTFESHTAACGYGPRTMCLSRTGDLFFIGCKDGTIWQFEAATSRQIYSPKGQASAIRALCEWTHGEVFVGKANGEIGILRRIKTNNHPGPKIEPSIDEEGSDAASWAYSTLRPSANPSSHSNTSRNQDQREDAGPQSVRALKKLGQCLLVSEKEETFLLDLGIVNSRDSKLDIQLRQAFQAEQTPLEPLVNEYQSSVKKSRALGSVFVAQRVVNLQDSDEFVVVVTELGQVYSWGPWRNQRPAASASIRQGFSWARGEQPAFVNDFGIFRSDLQRRKDRAARGLFLATDSGVFFVTTSSEGGLKEPMRLSLPGLGAVCMALGYAQDTQGFGYLWAIDSRGSCHLFCDEPCQDRLPNFRRTGFSHLDTQAVLAFGWGQAKSKEFLNLAYARRDDQVGIYKYQPVRHRNKEAAGKVEIARRILSTSWQPENVNYRSACLKQELLVLLFDDPSRREEAEAWPTYALLAELFEWLVEQSQGPEVLEEFLSNPAPNSAEAILWDLLEEERHPSFKPQDDINPSIKAIQVWTLSLLGIINRSIRENTERRALGVLRWYVRIKECLQKNNPHNILKVVQELEIASRMVKKWGIFGKISPTRRRLGSVIKFLRDQGEANRSLERLTYEATLFRRGVDLLGGIDFGEEEGRAAWDLKLLQASGQKVVAVSWNWGGVELFEFKVERSRIFSQTLGAIEPKPNEDGSYSPEFVADTKMRRHSPLRRPIHKYGYSRGIVLGRKYDTDFLLLSPAFERESQATETVYCWIRNSTGWTCSGSLQLPQSESVYSMLLLEDDLVLLGMRGTGFEGTDHTEVGQPGLLLLKVEDETFNLTKVGVLSIKSSALGAEATIENRVWSLARSDLPSDQHQVIIGCDGGQIWRITWPRNASFSQEKFDHCDEYYIEPVERLDSAVLTIAYRRDYGEATSRVFAGGSNGSITAWQEGRTLDDHTERPRFACLWSTLEQSPISSLHLTSIGSDPTQASQTVLRAITRDGTMVIFDDRLRPPKLDSWDRPKRLPIPGCRHGRFLLGSKVFAASELGLSVHTRFQDSSLLVATDRGTLKLLGLSAPHYTEKRRDHLQELTDLWQQAHRGAYMLRLSDMAHVAAEDVQFLVVRALLWVENADGPSPSKKDENADGPSPSKEKLLTPQTPSWCLPRHLRPLLHLARAWHWDSPDPKATGDALESSLRHARRLGDVRLFQEIVQLSLRRANFHVFSACQEPRKPGRAQKIQKVYFQIFEAIERSLEQWQGVRHGAELRVRMSVAKELVDGFTYHAVLEAAEVTGNRDSPFQAILEKRILGVRQLILKRDKLLNLESLRAANLSMMRCLWLYRLYRLQRRHTSEDSPETSRPHAPDLKGMPWSHLEPYLQHLLNGAVRGANHNAPLQHEFSRTFALAISLCPSATIRIFNRLTETRLITDLSDPEDFSRQVAQQLDILNALGLGLPDRIYDLYRDLCIDPKQTGPSQRERSLFKHFGDLQAQGPVFDDFVSINSPNLGEENAADAYSLLTIARIAQHFQDLGSYLTTDASRIDLSQEFFRDLQLLVNDLGKSNLYTQSYSFWKRAIDILEKRISPLEKKSIPGDPIRPKLVLQTRHLGSWAQEMRRLLQQSLEKLTIFEPEYSKFNEVLRQVQRAAEAFPSSAAVQKEIVVGVLGHHLLEELDEHILELEEIAQALDPVSVYEFRNKGRKAPGPQQKFWSVAERFANYLLRRAISAESIPKNLRAIHSLLSTSKAEPSAPATSKPRDLREVIADRYIGEDPMSWKFESEILGVKLGSYSEQAHLELALEELQQNHIKHSGLIEASNRPTVRVIEEEGSENSFDNQARKVEIVFRFLDQGLNLTRLKEIYAQQIQGPTPPSPERNIASSGTGLYLANLAASVVGWALSICEEPCKNGNYGECRFLLTRVPQPLQDSAKSERPA